MNMRLHKLAPAVLLAASLCISLAACSPSSQSSNSTADAKPTAVVNEVYASYAFTDWNQLIEDTDYLHEELGYNPHDSHYGEMSNCMKCHDAGEDGSSEVWCTSCHVGFEVPSGWGSTPVQGNEVANAGN